MTMKKNTLILNDGYGNEYEVTRLPRKIEIRRNGVVVSYNYHEPMYTFWKTKFYEKILRLEK